MATPSRSSRFASSGKRFLEQFARAAHRPRRRAGMFGAKLLYARKRRQADTSAKRWAAQPHRTSIPYLVQLAIGPGCSGCIDELVATQCLPIQCTDRYNSRAIHLRSRDTRAEINFYSRFLQKALYQSRHTDHRTGTHVRALEGKYSCGAHFSSASENNAPPPIAINSSAAAKAPVVAHNSAYKPRAKQLIRPFKQHGAHAGFCKRQARPRSLPIRRRQLQSSYRHRLSKGYLSPSLIFYGLQSAIYKKSAIGAACGAGPFD